MRALEMPASRRRDDPDRGPDGFTWSQWCDKHRYGSGRPSRSSTASEECIVDYSEHLRRLTIDDADRRDEAAPVAAPPTLDAKTRSLVRLGALVAVCASGPSICREVDDAVSAGAGACEIVDVLDVIMPLVGRPRIVTAAPRVARALGDDLDLLVDDP